MGYRKTLRRQRTTLVRDIGRGLTHTEDQGYGRGGPPVFTGVFEPVARVALYLADENGFGSCFGAA